MKKHLILSTILLLFYNNGFCQSGFATLLCDDMTVPTMCSIKEYQIVDSSHIVVRYQLKMVQDTIKNTTRKAVLILQIGYNFSKCFGLKMYLDDLVYTELMCGDLPVFEGASYKHTPTEEETREYRDAGDKIVDYEIFSDKETQTLINIHHGHNSFNWKMQYKEPIPTFNWHITGRQREILGYSCIEATCYFRGRIWQAWFATDIPTPAGPWKLSGLPGLILEASDKSGQFSFKCIEIKQHKEAICLYNVPTTTVTPGKYKKYERQMYKDPSVVLGNGGLWKFYYNRQEMGPNWSIPYNPIERQ